MKRLLRDKWVAKLRSGEIKQIRGYYRNGEGCCALGVLLDVIEEEYDPSYTSYYFPALEDSLNYFERMNLKQAISEEIIYLNDGEGLTFPEIADKIEKLVEVED